MPEGVWRWQVGKPELALSELYGNYRVKFPLYLTEDEKARLAEEHGDAPEGVQQSWRTNYTAGLSLGYIQKDGQYKSTKLIDFLAACFGSANGKPFRTFIAGGGGPPTTKDMSEAEQKHVIESWLGWVEDLEVLGTVRHEADRQQAGVVWARFAGPLPVGSLPGQREDDYQAIGRGKLRALVAESQGEVIDVTPVQRASVDQGTGEVLEAAPEPVVAAPARKQAAAPAAKTARSYDELFGEDEPAPTPKRAATAVATKAPPADDDMPF